MISERTCREWACLCLETCIPYACDTSCPPLFNPNDPCEVLQCVDNYCLPRRNHTQECYRASDHGLAVLTTCLLIGFVIAVAFAVVFCLTHNKRRFI